MARPGITHHELVGILCTLLCHFVRLILGDFLPDCYGSFSARRHPDRPESFPS